VTPPASQTLAASMPDANLPAWDLTDLYPGRDSDAVAADLAAAEREARGFAAAHAGKLASLTPAAFAAAMAMVRAKLA